MTALLIVGDAHFGHFFFFSFFPDGGFRFYFFFPLFFVFVSLPVIFGATLQTRCLRPSPPPIFFCRRFFFSRRPYVVSTPPVSGHEGEDETDRRGRLCQRGGGIRHQDFKGTYVRICAPGGW